jgi:hypothetical protein
MHSSGTSLTAGLLARLGVDFGPPEVARPARRVNTRELWEHHEITRLCDAVLDALGGTWDEPPELAEGWEQDPALEDLLGRGRELLEELFGGATLWGWKNPRTSLLLPFWWRILSGETVQAVVCVRHPVDVVASLHSRDGFPPQKTLALWRRYTTDALRYTTPGQRLICCYEGFWAGPGQLERVARFAGAEDALARQDFRAGAAEWTDPDLWRNRAGARDPRGRSIELASDRRLYATLRQAAEASEPSQERLLAAAFVGR